MRRLLLIVVALLLASASDGVAHAATGGKTVTASEGTVKATFTYELGYESSGGETFSNLKLGIERSGVSYYEQSVSSSQCLAGCRVQTYKSGPLAVDELEGGGQPSVVLYLNTDGAHCCTIVQVFSFDPGVETYRMTERNFGDPGALLTDVAGDGRIEFESADDRFAYEFASYAYSGLPLQIWRFSEGRFVDATSQFPQALAADAKRQFTYYLANRAKGFGLGFIAAWAADECLLGRRATVTRTLAMELRLHELKGEGTVDPGGRRFVKRLQSFLEKTGYT